MEKQVIYRDRQELQAADLNNTQTWADEAGQHLVRDAITPERQFVGLAVSGRSATELEVAPGRLYDGSSGKVFALDVAQVHSVFAMLPLQDHKWLAVSVFGQEEQTDIQPRDFLIDLQTREVEPEAVAMQRRRVATPSGRQALRTTDGAHAIIAKHLVTMATAGISEPGAMHARRNPQCGESGRMGLRFRCRPLVARFLNVDPYVQMPDNSQSLNTVPAHRDRL